MANNPVVYDPGTKAMLDAFGALMNNGFLKVYSGSQPAVDVGVTGTLLVTLTFGATAFASSTASGSGGSMSANSIGNGTAGNTGTAGYFVLEKSDSTVVASGSVGLTGADLNFDTLAIVSGAVVACSSFVVTQAQT